MYYGEKPPKEALAPYVAAYWHFRAIPGEEPTEHTIPPDGSLSLFADSSLPALGLQGPMTEPLTTLIEEPVSIWGVRFWPGAAASLLPLGGNSYRNTDLPPGSRALGAWGEEVALRLRGTTSEEQAARRWDQILGAELPHAAPLDEAVMTAVLTIIAAGGQVRIATLADQIGLSPRQLRRRFRARTGLSPKELARVRRIRAAIAPLALGATEPWAQVAAERGFADQAHLVHEVRRLFGRSPTVVLSYLRGIEHGAVIDR